MPERPRLVVVNATPVIALALLDQLSLLQHAPWIKLTPLQDPRRADLLSDLDRGEAEVIALAQEINANLVIIDERLARRHAKRLGLPSGCIRLLVKPALTNQPTLPVGKSGHISMPYGKCSACIQAGIWVTPIPLLR